MHVVGGLYKELCTIPYWNATFGSGGRAAAVISGFFKNVTLHTYAKDASNEGIAFLKRLGIDVIAKPRGADIAFAYFHPLSRPYIEPNLNQIELVEPIKVSGNTVLRFGFVEGDAIVSADRAVYDPQSWRNLQPFEANGSQANQLTIVLNELELTSVTGFDDLRAAAVSIFNSQKVAYVIVKRGIKGAIVFEPNGQFKAIPCYRSESVFKIGTGDVFSAVFTYFWGEEKLSPFEAADFASRAVAAYCNNLGGLPLGHGMLNDLAPWSFEQVGVVQIEGNINTLGTRYTLEEASYVLKDLGVEVYCPALLKATYPSPSAILILADGLGKRLEAVVTEAKNLSRPIVILCEDVSLLNWLIEKDNIFITTDFSTSLYYAAWVASEQ
jgi:hypothetical protein